MDKYVALLKEFMAGRLTTDQLSRRFHDLYDPAGSLEPGEQYVVIERLGRQLGAQTMTGHPDAEGYNEQDLRAAVEDALTELTGQ